MQLAARSLQLIDGKVRGMKPAVLQVLTSKRQPKQFSAG
jgi:hypothetical protein